MHHFTVALILAIALLCPSLVLATDVVDLSQLTPHAIPAQPLIDLGRDVRRGVVARVQLEGPLLSADGSLSAPSQFKILVSFHKTGTAEKLLEGQVAVRIFADDRVIQQTVRLEPQDEVWSGRLLLSSVNETMIKVGSKLADGKKRIYRFFYRPQPFSSEETPALELSN